MVVQFLAMWFSAMIHRESVVGTPAQASWTIPEGVVARQLVVTQAVAPVYPNWPLLLLWL